MNQVLSYLPRPDLQVLIETLQAAGFHCVGPRVVDGAIGYGALDDAAQLPWGVTEMQAPGHYRLSDSDTPRCFAWANGPQALKPFLFAPRENLWTSRREADGGLHCDETLPEAMPLAVIGVRPCDLAALALHDQHFLRQAVSDPYYARRREALFLVAVNCTHPAATCFCVSTGDGPRATYGYDLALTELDDGYLVEAHSERGRAIAAVLPLAAEEEAQVAAADVALQQAADSQTRRLPGTHLQAPLFANLNHPRWDEVAERCLSCGNCTSVCPTCFCYSAHDQPTLAGDLVEHYREWDSCFTQGHSYIHGITLRAETAPRYRQWLTHKLGSWHAQYGRSGCVGCGRCIAWCPVGIDLTEEAAAICGEVAPA